MARLDEIAEGIATVLQFSPKPEPLGVDLWNQGPVEALVLVRGVIDSCQRQAIPLSRVHVGPDLGVRLLKELAETSGRYEGIPVVEVPGLVGRVEFFRFDAGANG